MVLFAVLFTYARQRYAHSSRLILSRPDFEHVKDRGKPDKIRQLPRNG